MNPKDMKIILTHMMEDACRGDLEAVYRYYADNVVFQRPPFPPVTGKQANYAADLDMLKAYSNQRVIIHEISVEQDTAIVRYTWKAIHTGVSASMPIPPTGKELSADGCAVYHWQDGRIVEQWDFMDMLGLIQQLGLAPAIA
jgi:steroid delta-isomerase-like uncharacterized protein